MTSVLLDGVHLDFLHCADVLRDAMPQWLGAAPEQDHRMESTEKSGWAVIDVS